MPWTAAQAPCTCGCGRVDTWVRWEGPEPPQPAPLPYQYMPNEERVT